MKNGGTWGTEDPAEYSVGWVPKPTSNETQVEITRSGQMMSRPSCSYCTCDVLECLVQCKETGRYFCNGCGKNKHSHIIHHLVKSGNAEIVLPSENQFSVMPFECYGCQTKNIFLMSFVQSLKDEQYYLVCNRCMNDSRFSVYEFDIKGKLGLVDDNCLSNWFVRPPNREEEQSCLPIKIKDMDMLEDCWANGRNATIRDLPAIRIQNSLPSTKLQYQSKEEYCKVFAQLVEEEENENRKQKEDRILKHIETKFEMRFNTWFAEFKCHGAVALGEVYFVHANDQDGYGTVTEVRYNGSVRLKLKGFQSLPSSAFCDFKPVFGDIPFKRQQDALRRFKSKREQYLNPEITEYWLGKRTQQGQNLNNRKANREIKGNKTPLNDSQWNAVSRALAQRFTMIQGPPGTGKTTTIAAIVYNSVKQKKGRLLVCGPSNVTVEHLTHCILRTGVKTVRLMARNLDGIPSDPKVDACTVNNMIYTRNTRESDRLNELRDKLESESLSKKEESEYDELRTEIERDICSEADVVCCTTVTAGSKALEKMTFDIVVVDEATQAVEPHLLIPILHGSKQVVLVGDHFQLGPTIASRDASGAGLGVTILERLCQLGNLPIRLEVQYRMHPALCEFPSNAFYDGSLINGVSASDRTPGRAVFRWPKPETPLMFWHVEGEEERGELTTTYINTNEAHQVSQVVKKLLQAGVQPGSIGVITPYSAQMNYLRDYLNAMADISPEFVELIQIASVDAFQGGEKDYIILSCVRTKRGGKIGFLSDRRRLNVAITRARNGLIIIGNVRALSENAMWCDLIKHCESKGVLVCGEIDNLTPYATVLQPPAGRMDYLKAIVPRGSSGKSMIPTIANEETFPSDDEGDFLD